MTELLGLYRRHLMLRVNGEDMSGPHITERPMQVGQNNGQSANSQAKHFTLSQLREDVRGRIWWRENQARTSGESRYTVSRPLTFRQGIGRYQLPLDEEQMEAVKSIDTW